MNWLKYDEVKHIIEQLLNGHKCIFGERLVSYYLYDSLIWGDFDLDTSDIDTLCAN